MISCTASSTAIRIRSSKKPPRRRLIADSNLPDRGCFEFWLLLHFEVAQAPYARKDSVSPCDACIRDLRKYLSEYSKGDHTTFDALWPRLEDAIKNAYKVAADASAIGEPNSSTEVHKLVVRLLKLAERNDDSD